MWCWKAGTTVQTSVSSDTAVTTTCMCLVYLCVMSWWDAGFTTCVHRTLLYHSLKQHSQPFFFVIIDKILSWSIVTFWPLLERLYLSPKSAISWNSLAPNLENVTTHDSFKRMYKEYFLCTHIVLLYNMTTYNSLAELCFISCINMFK